ncbi:hypothetical protein [Streptomyces sp. NPDC095817]
MTDHNDQQNVEISNVASDELLVEEELENIAAGTVSGNGGTPPKSTN